MHGSRIVEIESDVEGFRVTLRIVLPCLDQGQHEILMVAQDCEGTGAAFQQTAKAEESFKECGETGYVRSGEIEMLELHGFHPSRFEKRAETKVDAAGEPNLA